MAPGYCSGVSLVSAITLGVSVAAVVATVTMGLLRFRHERKVADREDARSTLAGAAGELGRVKSAMRDALTAFDQPLGTGEDWPEDFWDHMRKLEAAAESLEGERDAARIRFAAETAVVEALGGATKALRSLLTVYFLAHQHRGPKWEDRREQKEDQREAMTLSQEFDRYRDDFLGAAQRVVGVELSR